MLPGGEQSITATAVRLGELLAPSRTHFNRGGVVTRVGDDDNLRIVRTAEIASDFESVARLTKIVVTQAGASTVPTICDKKTAELILNSDALKNGLPELTVVSRCPVTTGAEWRAHRSQWLRCGERHPSTW